MTLKRRSFIFSLGASLLFSFNKHLSAQSDPLEISVVGMVENAAIAIEDQGLKQALINSPQAIWIREESRLYIFIIDGDGFLLLHPDRRMIGANIRGSRDVQGKPFILRILKALQNAGETFWSEYLWFDPIDGRTRRKRVYSKKVGDLIVNCGYYLDQA